MQHLPICKYNPILHIPSTCLSMLTKLTVASRLCCQVACHFVYYQIYLRYFVRTYLSPVDEGCAGFDIAIASFVAKYTQYKWSNRQIFKNEVKVIAVSVLIHKCGHGLWFKPSDSKIDPFTWMYFDWPGIICGVNQIASEESCFIGNR